MATLIRHRWTFSFEGMSRRDRQGCDYDAYLPDPLAGWHLPLSADLVADLTDAEAAIRRLNTSTFARQPRRARPVPPARRVRRLLEDRRPRGRAAIHRILMEQSSMPHIGGVVRTTQNWNGGSSYNPCSAAFVPPPPESLDALLNDLLDYANGDHHPALVQGAIAHRNSFLTACPSISAPTNDPAWRTPSMVSTVHRCLANGQIGIAHTLHVADVRQRVRRASGGSLAATT